MLCIQSWSLKKSLVIFWNSRMLYSRSYCYLYPKEKPIQMKFADEFSNTVLCLWELHVALKYTCLWRVRSVDFFFVDLRRYFSICSSEIYYTICFNDFQQPNLSRYKAVRSPACRRNPARPRRPDSKIIRQDQRLEWKDTVKNGEVSEMK